MLGPKMTKIACLYRRIRYQLRGIYKQDMSRGTVVFPIIILVGPLPLLRALPLVVRM